MVFVAAPIFLEMMNRDRVFADKRQRSSLGGFALPIRMKKKTPARPREAAGPAFFHSKTVTILRIDHDPAGRLREIDHDSAIGGQGHLPFDDAHFAVLLQGDTDR